MLLKAENYQNNNAAGKQIAFSSLHVAKRNINHHK